MDAYNCNIPVTGGFCDGTSPVSTFSQPFCMTSSPAAGGGTPLLCRAKLCLALTGTPATIQQWLKTIRNIMHLSPTAGFDKDEILHQTPAKNHIAMSSDYKFAHYLSSAYMLDTNINQRALDTAHYLRHRDYCGTHTQRDRQTPSNTIPSQLATNQQ